MLAFQRHLVRHWQPGCILVKRALCNSELSPLTIMHNTTQHAMQDTSLLRRDAYQRQMSAWLAAATPIERSQLRRMCRTSSNSTTTGSRSVTRRWPAWTTATKAEEDHGDLLVHYNSNSRAFMKIAVKLDPMLHDLKVRREQHDGV